MCSSPEEGLQLRESEGIKCKVLAHLTEAARCSCSGSSTPSSSMKALSAAVAASSGSSATSGAGPGESHTPMTAAISRECAAVRLETCLQYWHVSVSNAMVQDEDSSCGRHRYICCHNNCAGSDETCFIEIELLYLALQPPALLAVPSSDVSWAWVRALPVRQPAGTQIESDCRHKVFSISGA